MQVVPAFHLYNRATRKPHPNWERGPSIHKPANSEVKGIFQWTKENKHKRIMFVDPYGVCEPGKDTPTNDEGSTTCPRSFWTTSYHGEGVGNSFIAEAVMNLSCEILTFVGAPPKYNTKTPAFRLHELTRAVTELKSFITRFPRVRLVIDTGGWLINHIDSPLTSILADPILRRAIDLEGLRYQSDAVAWPSTIWLGMDEIVELFTPATIPPSISGWIQGSREDQIEKLEIAKIFKLSQVCLEATVWGDDWNEMYESLTNEKA